VSQSLLFEVWFPTYIRIQANAYFRKGVAIPSIWGLVSYALLAAWPALPVRSQSLLFEVWFPTEEDKLMLSLLRECRNPFYLRSGFLPVKNSLLQIKNEGCRNPFYLRSGFLRTLEAVYPQQKTVAIPSIWGLVSYGQAFGRSVASSFRRNPFYLRSGFLQRQVEVIYDCMVESQSLLFEVWFPTSPVVQRCGSYLHSSQSLLFEVWFPTRWTAVYDGSQWTVSQSLLNEVWFPTWRQTGRYRKAKRGSQSLLNEVWFPTII